LISHVVRQTVSRMAVDLVGLIKISLTPDVVQKAAAYVGESESATQKALNPIVLTLVAATTTEVLTAAGALKLGRFLDAGGYDKGALSALGGLFLGKETTRNAINDGRNVLNTLLGTKTIGLAHLIARDTNVAFDSVCSLMALMAPLVMFTLEGQKSTAAADPAGWAGLLGQQNGNVGNLLPIGIAPFLDWRDHEGVRDEAVSYGEPNRLAPRWFFAVLFFSGVVLMVLAWLVSLLPKPVAERAGAARPIVRNADLPVPGQLKTAFLTEFNKRIVEHASKRPPL
jgi:Bacterial protein of unknown function (DUF937)